MTATATEVAELDIPRTAESRTVRSVLVHNRSFVFGLIAFVALVLIALVASILFGPGPLRSGAFRPKLGPGTAGALLGTTTLGQSVLAQLAVAIPRSCLVGLLAATIGTSLGGVIGLVGGYFGGKVDAVLRVLVDVFLAVPSLLFLIFIASLLHGVSVPMLALIIGLFAWAWPARAVRSQVLSLKERPFVQVALLSGLSGIEVVWTELLPHLMPFLGANFVNAFIAGVLAESGLSILGLGPQQDMTLGMMIYWSLSYSAILQNLWWWWMPPVALLISLFMALYLVHIGLDEISNPRLRGAS
jgi:peptide/nickel transport system permease protein